MDYSKEAIMSREIDLTDQPVKYRLTENRDFMRQLS